MNNTLQIYPEFLIAITGLIGLLIGSFLNVVIYRLPIMMEKAWRKELKKIKGVQVYTEQTITMMGQPMKSTIELMEIKEGKAPSNIFELPTGYKKAGAFR